MKQFADVRAGAVRVDDSGKATQVVAAHVAGGRKIGSSSVCDGLTGEFRQGQEIDTPWIDATGGEKSSDDRRFHGMGSLDLAGLLAAEIGVVDLHAARQRKRGFMCRHDRYQRVVDRLGGDVVGARPFRELQGRQRRIVAADQIACQEPRAQRHFGAAHHCVGDLCVS